MKDGLIRREDDHSTGINRTGEKRSRPSQNPLKIACNNSGDQGKFDQELPGTAISTIFDDYTDWVK